MIEDETLMASAMGLKESVEDSIPRPHLLPEEWLRVCALRLATTCYNPDNAVPFPEVIATANTIFEYLKEGKLPPPRASVARLNA